MDQRFLDFIDSHEITTPSVLIDLHSIENNFNQLKEHFPLAEIFYAVKANPAPKIIQILNSCNSSFDTASIPEIKLCLEQGCEPHRLSFGNTIKKERDIKTAYDLGIRLYAFDSKEELMKLSRAAPGSKVFCRILTNGEGAEWPLSRKFGCSTEMACDLLIQARELGLHPYGVSFHVGSQQTNIAAWDDAILETKYIFDYLKRHDIFLQLINMGGGFPAQYNKDIPSLSQYSERIMTLLEETFEVMPRIILEPGRSLVGDSGTIVSEVVLVSQKDYQDTTWVFLDVGKFGGLAETADESIKYRITCNRGGETHPVILAGPTCDSADILYENNKYNLPKDLKCGDTVYIHSTGAYTSSYSAVEFNGFEPLKTYFYGGYDEN